MAVVSSAQFLGTAGEVIGAGIAGGVIGDSSQSAVNSAQIAQRAVENNLLSKQKEEMVYAASEEYHKKGMLLNHKQKEVAAALVEDSEIDRLIILHQTAPERMTVAQKAYLDKELKVIAASYNIPVENLYNWDFSKTITRDDSALKTYLSSQNALRNSYDMKQAQSLKEGLETVALVGGANVATNVMSKTAAAAAATKTGQRISHAVSEASLYVSDAAKVLAQKSQAVGKAVANEAKRTIEATKYVAGELAKDMKAGAGYLNEAAQRGYVNYQNSQLLTNAVNAIPKEYKVALGIEATTGVMVESLYYFNGSKELNPSNLLNSGYNVGVDSIYGAVVHKLNPVYGVIADTTKGVVVDGKNITTSTVDAAQSGSFSTLIDGGLSKLKLDDSTGKFISSFGSKYLEYEQEINKIKDNK